MGDSIIAVDDIISAMEDVGHTISNLGDIINTVNCEGYLVPWRDTISTGYYLHSNDDIPSRTDHNSGYSI